jgi:hypothetical protein
MSLIKLVLAGQDFFEQIHLRHWVVRLPIFSECTKELDMIID